MQAEVSYVMFGWHMFMSSCPLKITPFDGVRLFVENICESCLRNLVMTLDN